MKQKYTALPERMIKTTAVLFPSKIKKFIFATIIAAGLSTPAVMHSQVQYTLGTQNTPSTTLGVTPFSTSNMNSRSQYLYLAEELLDQGAISGNITEIAINITSLALPSALRPENVQIKMGTTSDVTLGTTVIEGLPVYYTASVVDITSTGWYTFVLDTPFEWNGLRNIIVEVCRNNDEIGTSFGVETTLFNQTDYRTTGLYTNSATPGCTLTGTTPMTNPERRIRPNLRVTMTNPCTGTPEAGTTVVSGSGNYCSGTPFTLSVANGSIESGLYYQWQWAPLNTGPWNDIPGANNGTLTTAQAISTWYRRATICIDSQQTINSFPLLVGGAGCYCAAEVMTTNDVGITNVTFNGINNDSDTSMSYSNYTTMQTTVLKGQSYPLSVRVNTDGGTNYTKAWIDWNRNAIYDANEGYSLGNVTGGTDVNSGIVANIMIPSDAVVGNTNMRIRTSQGSTNTEPDACNTIENGEGEDYTINVQPAMGVPNHGGDAIAVLVQSSANGLMVRTQTAMMSTVSVYDISGRLLAQKSNINDNNVVLNVTKTPQVLLVKVQTSTGAIINKKVIL